MLISPSAPTSVPPPRTGANAHKTGITRTYKSAALTVHFPDRERGAFEFLLCYFLEPPADGAEGADTLVVRMLIELLEEMPPPSEPEDDHDDPDELE